MAITWLSSNVESNQRHGSSYSDHRFKNDYRGPDLDHYNQYTEAATKNIITYMDTSDLRYK